MVSCAPNTPCIQHVTHSVASSGSICCATAQQCAVPAQHGALLVAQDNMAAVSALAGVKKDRSPAVDALDVRAAGDSASSIAASSRRIGDSGWRILQQRCASAAESSTARRPLVPAVRGTLLDQREVGISRSGRMVCAVDAKESPRGRGAGRQCDGRGLQCGTGSLVLQAHRREIRPKGDGETIGIAMGGAHQLPEIGRKAGSTLETAVRDPRMPAVLRKILPPHEDRTHAGMPGDMMVDVLARIGLIVHQEAPVRPVRDPG